MKNHILKLLLATNIIFMLAANLLGPLFAIFVQRFDGSVVTISLTWAVFIGSASIFMLILYRFGDRINKLQLLQLGFLIRAIAWLSYIFVGNIWGIFAVQVLLGLGEAFGTPAYEALFAEHLDDHRHIADYSEMWIAYNIVTAIAVVIGGVLVNYYGFPTLFIIMSVLALGSFGTSLKLTYLLRK